MWRAPRFVIPALAVFVLACGWLLAHAYARQLQAHVQCPTWPECYRPASVVTETLDVRDGELAQSLADGGLWLALAGLAGFGRRRRESAFDRRWIIPLTALVLVTLGAATRYAYVGPGVSLSQWLTALLVCALLWWLVLRERRFLQPLLVTRTTRALRPRVLAALALTLAASAFGGWALAHGIGLPCPDFPACRNEWWPTANLFADIARITRPDDETAAAALVVSHRLTALIALLYVGWLGLHLWRTGVRDHLCRYGMLLLSALLVVAGLGIMGAVTRLPPATVMAHSAAAAVLILSLVTLYHVLRPVNRPGNPNA